MKTYKTLTALYHAVKSGEANNELVHVVKSGRMIEVRNLTWWPPVGSECRKVWDIGYKSFMQGICDKKVITKICTDAGLNPGNVGLELKCCFQHYGLAW